METKVCTACHIEKPLDDFHWQNKAKNRRSSKCGICRNIEASTARRANPEKHRAAVHAWGKRNPDKIRAKREANQNKIRAQERARYWANPEKERDRHRKWQHENPDKVRASTRAWQHKNPEKVRINKHAWQEANAEKVRNGNRAWRKANPERVRAHRHARRARKAIAPINDLTALQWKEIKAAYRNRCVYCDRKMERLTQDHITPLSKGGSHTASNILPACISCNSKKRTGAVLVQVQPLLITLAPSKDKNAK